MRHSLFLLLTLVALGPVWAQSEVDRVRDAETDRRDVAPVDSLVRLVPSEPEYLPEEDEIDFSQLPDPERQEAQEDAEPDEDAIEFKLDGAARVIGGHDTNVFRADRGGRGDAFFRSQGEIELLTKFPQGSEIFVEVSGESLLYADRTKANEHYVVVFLEYYQPLTPWLDVGVQNAFEFSRLNLLDDNGDLFPRGRFGSIDEEVRAFVIFRPQLGGDEGDGAFRLRDLALELGASYRDKNYDENTGVESLDYDEVRLDGAISYKLSRRPRSRLKLKYRFRRRAYREFRARERDGTPTINERLELQRHQLNLTLFQEMRLGETKGRLIMSLGGVYNRDIHENDRSYREVSGSARAEWWPVEDRTRLDISMRAVARNFLVRRSNDTGRLRHRLISVSVGVWQVLGDVPPKREGEDVDPRRRPAFRVQVAVFARARAVAWRSRDVFEDYDRYLFEGGLEASW